MKNTHFLKGVFIVLLSLSLLIGSALDRARAEQKQPYRIGVNLDITGYSASRPLTSPAPAISPMHS